jgi:hypothetical protein
MKLSKFLLLSFYLFECGLNLHTVEAMPTSAITSISQPKKVILKTKIPTEAHINFLKNDTSVEIKVDTKINQFAEQTLIPFIAESNSSFRIAVASEHGGLKQQGFLELIPYNLTLLIDGYQTKDIAAEECNHNFLEIGSFQEKKVYKIESNLLIKFKNTVHPLDYVAGVYQDTITITVEAYE